MHSSPSRLIGILNLSSSSQKIVSTSMGHDVNIHENFYNLPSSLNTLLTMGLTCSMFESDSVHSKRGQSLEELMEINPPEATGCDTR